MNLIRSLILSSCALAAAISITGCAGAAASSHKHHDDSFDFAEDRKPTEKTLYAMARILIDQGRYSEAEVTLVHIIHEKPEFVPAYVTLGALDMKLGRRTDAAAVFFKGLEAAPNDPV